MGLFYSPLAALQEYPTADLSSSLLHTSIHTTQMSYNKKKKPAQAAAPGDTLPEETKTQIKTFKEMFPKYKSSTNDDILAVFAEFNNNFEAAVYGVMNNLVVNKPSAGWQSVDKKKKKKNQGTRSNSTNPRGRANDTESRNRRDNRESRGQSTNRGSSSNRPRGGPSSQANRPSGRPSEPKPTPPPTQTKAPVAPSEQPKPQTQAPSGPTPVSVPPGSAWGPRGPAAAATAPRNTPASNQSTHTPVQKSTAPVQAQKPSNAAPSNAPYAEVAKTRQAWKPQSAAGNAPASQNVSAPAKSEPVAKSAPQPVEQKPVDAQPAQQAAPIPVEVSPVVSEPAAPAQESLLKPKAEEKPRVGVLLPGNFSGEDMSFQFGNLGLSFGDSELGGRVQEDIKSGSSLVNDSSRVPNSLGSGSNNGDMQRLSASKQDQEVETGMPQFSPYPGYPGMEAPGMGAPPHMSMYYPEANRGAEGKFQRGPNSQNYSSGRDNASGKFPEGAGPQAAQGYPYYPIYGFPNQYPGASYGNHMAYGYRPNFYQNFTGMPYTPEEDYKMRSMAYGYGPQESVPSGKSQGSSSGGQKQRKDNSSEGGFSAESNYAKNPTDYYQQDMYGSFNQQYYPMMGQHYQPPPQPQQPQQSSQQSQQPSQGSRNY